MKSSWILAVGLGLIYLFPSCSKKNQSEQYQLTCDTLLQQMDQQLLEFIPKNKDRDSLSLAMNLTTLRYQLQGFQYEIESKKVPQEDSLYWVGALHLAVTIFGISWEVLPAALKQSTSDAMDNVSALEMNRRLDQGVRFYLKYAGHLPDIPKAYWTNRLNQIRSKS